jgi:hypothetical protein
LPGYSPAYCADWLVHEVNARDLPAILSSIGCDLNVDECANVQSPVIAIA